MRDLAFIGFGRKRLGGRRLLSSVALSALDIYAINRVAVLEIDPRSQRVFAINRVVVLDAP